MKKILFVVVALIAFSQLNAKGIEPKSPLGISVIKHGAIFKLFYRGEQTGKVKVTIYGEKGQVVFQETLLNTDQFMRPYNFRSLPEGEYTIELKDEKGERIQKINHTSSKEIRVAHLVRLKNSENKYKLAVPNKGQDALVIKIYDEQNNIVYEETEFVDGNFAKVYDLNQISGQPFFEVIDKNGPVNILFRSVR